MKCLKCGKEIKDGMSKCPNCGKALDEDLELDLPALKNEEDELSDTEEFKPDLVKTKSVSDGSKTKELKVLEDIGKAKEKDDKESSDDDEKDEKPVAIKKVNEEKDKDVKEVLRSKESVDSRKQILILMLICFGIVIVGMIISIHFIKDRNFSSTNGSYIVNMETALGQYYDYNNIDDVVFVLEDVKSDEEKVRDVQRITRITCDNWIAQLINRDIKTSEEYEEVTDKYRGIINGLHDDAVVKNDNVYVKALRDADYEELITQVDNIISDGSSFFDAVAMYNVKDYNKAYYLFGKITMENAYYDKAQEYLDKIVTNVVDILKTDIRKVEIGMDGLSDNEKLNKYIQIEEIILAYKSTYATLELDKQDKYIEILNGYQNKIGEFGVLSKSGL